MSKRVLLICYYFPPLGLGGVGRPLNLFKRLSNHGWQCDILTVKPVLYRAYEPELVDNLDQSRIYRSGSHDPQRLLYLLGIRQMKAATITRSKPVSSRFFPDSKIGWVSHAIRLGDKLCQRNKYDAIISSSPPISSHLIGRELNRKHGIPWLADFRDFWTIYKAEDEFHDVKRQQRARQLLDEIRTQAMMITGVNQSVVDYVGGGVTITNGYDPDLAEQWRREPASSHFSIGLLGHQHDTRELEPLFDLLTSVRDQNPELFAKMRLIQVGQIDSTWFNSLLEKHNLKLQVDLHRRQTRANTIRILAEAHLFYFGVSEREGPGFVPGRTFELIASGRPILACAEPNSEIAQLLAPVANSCCFGKSDSSVAFEKLIAWGEAFTRGQYQFEPLTDYARQFSADELARKFAMLLDSLT